MDHYMRLAGVQGSHPGDFAIFRRYLSLHALRLNRLQGDIARLQTLLGVAADQDREHGDPEQILSDLRLPTLNDSGSAASTPSQVLLWWKELDAKLAVYADGLIRFHKLCQLKTVDARRHERLRTWIRSADGGRDAFIGSEGAVWNAEYADDLVLLSSPEHEGGILASIIENSILTPYQDILGHRRRETISIRAPFTGKAQRTPFYHYADKYIHAAASAVNTFLASITVSLSMLCLYFIDSPGPRVGAVIGFTCIFSLMTTWVAGSSRAECFMATSAYAAVLVVFIGGTGGVID